MSKINCELNTLYGLVHVSYTRDKQDTLANSIKLRVTIPSNAQARVMFEPLFTGGRCVRLVEGDNIIWSMNTTPDHLQNFEVKQNVMTGLMTVHVGSGEYEFQALWE